MPESIIYTRLVEDDIEITIFRIWLQFQKMFGDNGCMPVKY